MGACTKVKTCSFPFLSLKYRTKWIISLLMSAECFLQRELDRIEQETGQKSLHLFLFPWIHIRFLMHVMESFRKHIRLRECFPLSNTITFNGEDHNGKRAGFFLERTQIVHSWDAWFQLCKARCQWPTLRNIRTFSWCGISSKENFFMWHISSRIVCINFLAFTIRRRISHQATDEQMASNFQTALGMKTNYWRGLHDLTLCAVLNWFKKVQAAKCGKWS